MIQIQAIDFYREWIKTVINRKDEMLSIWQNNPKLTLFVKGSKKSIISEISKKLGLLSRENDYYSIDAIMFEQNDIIPNVKPDTYRDIKIAFEHENTFNSGLFREVSHLLITNSLVKVLVSYPNYEPDEKLKSLHKIIKETRHSKDLSEKENFLIIFGYENGFEWEGYIYKENNWRKIKL
jgi:uncharacterized protein YihD (DUF1040 family)